MTVTAGISWRAQGELLVFVSALTPELVFHFLRSSAGRSAAPTPNPCCFCLPASGRVHACQFIVAFRASKSKARHLRPVDCTCPKRQRSFNVLDARCGQFPACFSAWENRWSCCDALLLLL
ncbi:hypothetical protein BD311DRAFT_765148 [Dichomitus squalens]|uniref:Uncharacterized protein n=1 Tax=Dichomitus squalens TaxID=114155 RepID=A0A4Q9MCT3_9APHY|nr:hypothetical protein BD311DRAFT_765148 [Dichomitus squalens]